ncbi:MAG: hypothetical protein PVF09_09425 [Desulfobacterales bacterium]
MTNILSNTDGGLITADNSAVVFIDHQPQMTFGVANIERQQLVNNVVMLAKGARLFGVPAIQRLYLATVNGCLSRAATHRTNQHEFMG